VNCFDPLEETVGADDITGRNNCPIWKRISAVGCFAPDQRVSIMNGSRNSDKAKASRGPKGNIWAVIDGKIEQTTQHNLAIDLQISVTAISSAKSKELRKRPESKEAKVYGIRFGWDDPPEVWEGK